MPAKLRATSPSWLLRPRHGAAGLLMAALTACSMGPDYHPVTPITPAGFHGLAGDRQSTPVSATLASQPDPVWWRNFQDPELNSLIDRAIAGNLNLQQAVLRIAGAREQTLQAGAAGLPSATANARVTREQLGVEGFLDSSQIRAQAQNVDPQLASRLDGLTRPINLYQGSFDATWEIDLWGRVRRSIEAANAQTQSSMESRNDALVSLEAEVARSYLQLRGAQSVAQTLQTQIDVARQTLELTRSRQRNGLAPQTDVENAAAQLGSLQAQLPAYQAQQRQAMNALAVLLGQPPGTLDKELAQPKPLPALPAAVAVGVPSTLARRRPDIRQAEANLHAATANIGVSIAQLFPDLSLTGQFGTRNDDADYLTHWSSHFWSIGPQISLPIFQGGKLVASVRLARIDQANAALAYRQTVLSALQDVENALVSYHTDQDRVTGLEQTAQSTQNAFELARDSYRNGLSSFINLLDAERQLAQARQQLAAARVETGVDLVSLYKALGGGWENYPASDLPHYPVFGPAATVNNIRPAKKTAE
ncbi:efflux transporter outer membrane subunit [Martelella alba]|uniref:Efflux transporter outer membrane subunit n=1 Tax=Martelella alba TaxID=2590451 RepID=A0ABY2SQ31_9HYPH|nr:efflux transporter outer membrane subunit [Martelella alba]TKI07422.1 efflux transporter outer membrane subunit [Martelella alba]